MSSFTRGSVARSAQGIPVSTIATVLVVACIVMSLGGFLIYRLMISSLQSKLLTSGVIYCSNTYSVASGALPSMSNGKEWSTTFWLYIDNLSPSQEFKTIMTFGGANKTMGVFMDKALSSIFFVFKTTKVTSSVTDVASMRSGLTSFVGVKPGSAPPSIDYTIVPYTTVPIGRWIMLSIVVDQDIVQLYVDNNLYSVNHTGTFSSGIITPPDNTGVAIGSTTSGADAYLTKLKFYNHAISVFDVRGQYSSGPGDSRILGWLGLGKYKLQWPIANSTGS